MSKKFSGSIWDISKEETQMYFEGAIRIPKAEALPIWIKLGAQVDAKDNMAIRVVARHGYIDTAKLLIEAGADVTANGNEAINNAVSGGYPDMVTLLISAGADAKAVSATSIRNTITMNKIDILEILLNEGNEHITEIGNVIEAVSKGNVEALKLLAKAGADFNSQIKVITRCVETSGNPEIINVIRGFA